MTNSMFASGNYASSVWCDSAACAGVRFRVARMSLGRRIALARKIREAGRGVEFFEASNDAREKIEAAILRGEIERVYLEWGLEEITGLVIDGEPATPALLIERGPAELAAEVLTRIQAECGLDQEQQKN